METEKDDNIPYWDPWDSGIHILQDGLIFTEESAQEAGFKDNDFFKLNKEGDYKNKSFSLSPDYKWKIIKEDNGTICLLPEEGDMNRFFKLDKLRTYEEE